MSIRLGDIAPDFTAETTEGSIKFHDWLGNSWGVLFSHPADFTPVCTTELGAVAKLRSEFDKRNVKVMAISADPLDSHNRWIGDINETQKTVVNYPLIADPTIESTKKRCRKTKSTSGGSTASVAPAITRPVLTAPRL